MVNVMYLTPVLKIHIRIYIIICNELSFLLEAGQDSNSFIMFNNVINIYSIPCNIRLIQYVDVIMCETLFDIAGWFVVSGLCCSCLYFRNRVDILNNCVDMLETLDVITLLAV